MKTTQEALSEKRKKDAAQIEENKTQSAKRLSIMIKVCEHKRSTMTGLMSSTEIYELTKKMLERLKNIIPTVTHLGEIIGITKAIEHLNKIISYRPSVTDITSLSSLGKAVDDCLTDTLEPSILLYHYAKELDKNDIAWALSWEMFLKDLNENTKELLRTKTLGEMKEALHLYLGYIQYLYFYNWNKYYLDLSPHEAAKELYERFNALIEHEQLFLEALNPSMPVEIFSQISAKLKTAVKFIKYITSPHPIEHLRKHSAQLTPELKAEFDVLDQNYIKIAIDSILDLAASPIQYQQIVTLLNKMCHIISLSDPSHPSDANALFNILELSKNSAKAPNKKLNKEETYLRIEKLIQSITMQNHFLTLLININSFLQPFDFYSRNLLLLDYKNSLEAILPTILYPSSFNLEAINAHVDQIVEELGNFDVLASLKELENLENVNRFREKLRTDQLTLSREEKDILDKFDVHYLVLRTWIKPECIFLLDYNKETRTQLTAAFESYIALKAMSPAIEEIIENHQDFLKPTTHLPKESTQSSEHHTGVAAKRRAARKAKSQYAIPSPENQAKTSIPQPDNTAILQNTITQESKSIEEGNEETCQVGGAAVEVDRNGVVVSDTSDVRPTTPSSHLTKRAYPIFEQFCEHVPKTLSQHSIHYHFNKIPLGYYICLAPSVLREINDSDENKFYKAISNNHVKKLIGHDVFELYISGDPRILGKIHSLTTSQLKKYFNLWLFYEFNGVEEILDKITREGNNIKVVIFDEYAPKHNAIDRHAKRITTLGVDYSTILEKDQQYDKTESKINEELHTDRITQTHINTKTRER